ncbi:MAG TPA: T9SS type A sorting domain-containing protein [Bacteroidia bacterium]|nr:T9SS type A sorting domain-containing protein [Bacteroidia bacterium]
MRGFIFTLAVCISSVASAQFAPLGSQWHYTQCTVNFPYTCGPVQVNATGQFTVNGKTCTNLQIAPFTCVGINNIPVYQSNDTVYRFLYNVNTFTMLYDFNAHPGDTWNIVSNTMYQPPPAPLVDSVLVRVDSINYISINGQQRKMFYISYADTTHIPFVFEGPIIEGIGSLNFLFPQFTGCDPQATAFRCYRDSSLGLYQLNSLIDCDSVIAVGESEIIKGDRVMVYPNPFEDKVCIYSDDFLYRNYNLILTNTYGETVYRSTQRQALNQITYNWSFLPKGVYFLTLESDKKILQKRLIKL